MQCVWNYVTNSEGNHGEDVKEVYFYLDATPTHSYLKAHYKYPQREFPNHHVRDENKQRGRQQPECEMCADHHHHNET